MLSFRQVIRGGIEKMRILTALSQRARQWVQDNIYFEDWQLVSGGIAGDWRMIEGIAEAMSDEGFRQTRRWWQFWVKLDFVIS